MKIQMEAEIQPMLFYSLVNHDLVTLCLQRLLSNGGSGISRENRMVLTVSPHQQGSKGGNQEGTGYLQDKTQKGVLAKSWIVQRDFSEDI